MTGAIPRRRLGQRGCTAPMSRKPARITAGADRENELGDHVPARWALVRPPEVGLLI